MKRSVCYLSLILFLSFIFWGCEKNNQESHGPVVVQGQYVQVSAVNQLQAFNDSLLMVSTRGLWSTFKRACIIAGADIAGAGAGIATVKEIAFVVGAATSGTGALVVFGCAATICGVGASAAAFDACFGSSTRGVVGTFDTKKMQPDLLLGALDLVQQDFGNGGKPEQTILLPKRFEYLNDVGILHNSMLVKLEDIYDNKVDLTQINPDPNLKKIVMSDEFNTSYQAIINSTVVSQDASGLDLDKYSETDGIRLSGLAKKVYDLFLEAYGQFPEDINDVKMLVNRYINIVEASSEFTDSEKEQIYTGLVIAANSPLYWQDKF